MRWKENLKKLLLFFAVVLLFALYLFWGEGSREEEPKATEPTWQSQEESTPGISEAEKREAERLRKQTVSYLWEGTESGVPCKETLTLLGDGKYILRIELSEHDPFEESGTWRQEEKLLILTHSGTRQEGTIEKKQIRLEGKTYQRTVSGHV